MGHIMPENGAEGLALHADHSDRADFFRPFFYLTRRHKAGKQLRTGRGRRSLRVMSKLTHGVSWPEPELLDAARRRASSLGMNFSSYINQLVRRDLGLGNAFQAGNITGSNVAIGTKGKVRQVIGTKQRRG
jgi:hypothetical protein